MTDLVVRAVAPEELSRLKTTFADWGYSVSTNPDDTFFLAEESGRCLGIVRRTCEESIYMLRTMMVAPGARGRGVGTQLLKGFVQHLEGRVCYCIAYRHLINFYGRGEFVQQQPETAPPLLGRRLDRYRSEGLDVVLMCKR